MPRKPRPNPLTIRFPPDERAEIASRAEQAGVSIGGYLRMAALAVPKRRVTRRPSVDQVELGRLLGAVGKIGSNLNQLAYVANTGGWPDSRAIAEAVADIHWMRDTLMRALGVTPPGQPPPDPIDG